MLSEVRLALRCFSIDHHYAATVSVGALTFISAVSADTMIAMADSAMYAIKQSAKNNVEFKLAKLG